MSIKDFRPVKDFVRPTLETIGGPKRLGVATAAATFPLLYYLSKRTAQKNLLPDARKRALIVSGVLSPLLGWGMYAMSRRRDGLPYDSPKDFADGVLGTGDIKSASDSLMDKGMLMQGVDELPASDLQKSFLNEGIRFAPGDTETTLWGLGDGFGQAVDRRTGSILDHTTRAIEGAIIGSAFGALAGLSPTNRRWAAGIGAVADSLKGSEFFNALGDFG